MANHRSSKFEKILEMLEENIAPKVISSVLEVPYDTVITMKNRFFKTVLKRKENVPSRDQGHFFNYWRT